MDGGRRRRSARLRSRRTSARGLRSYARHRRRADADHHGPQDFEAATRVRGGDAPAIALGAAAGVVALALNTYAACALSSVDSVIKDTAWAVGPVTVKTALPVALL